MKTRFFLFSILMGIGLGITLQIAFSYYFLYIEQSQLFLLTTDYAWGLWREAGGFALWLSELVVQYFAYPHVGAWLMAGLITLSAIGSGFLLYRLSHSRVLAYWGWLPACALLCASLDFNYNYQGIMAYLLFLFFAIIYISVRDFYFRIGIGVLSLLALLGSSGTVYALFALFAWIYEISRKEGRRKWVAALMPLVALMLGYYLYLDCWTETLGGAFSPRMYYHPKLDPKGVIYYAWGAFLVLSVIGGILVRRENPDKGKRVWIGETISALLLIGAGAWGICTYGDWKSLRFMELDYYSRTGQWTKIEENCEGKLTNYLYMFLLARALSEEEKLATDLFRYNFRDEKALAIPWNKSENISTLLSDLYFTCGNTALAQRMAFEGNMGARGKNNARLIQRLIQTNLIFGEYIVAEKYIRLMEKSPVYHNWAKSQRVFLQDDKAVEQDPVLGVRRALLPPDSVEVMASGTELIPALSVPVLANPEKAKVAFEYLAAYYLLSRDMNSFIALLNSYKDEVSWLAELPVIYQEGVLVAFENRPEKWKEYALNPDIVNSYVDFRKQVLANRENSGLPGLLRRTYGDTYWFYLMFSK